MNLAVTEHYHDYQPRKYYVDSTKLDPKNHVDSQILKAIKGKGLMHNVNIDASDWEDNPVFDDEPGISESAKVKNITKIDKSITLRIDFDC